MRYSMLLSLSGLLLSTPAGAEVPRVVTDIPPVHSLVAIVMGDLGTPDLLVDKGADPHSFQLRPSQAASLSDADLIVWIGHEMTPWLERMLEGLETNAEQIELLDAPGTKTRSYSKDRGDDHAGRDPHAWLDPQNAVAWLGVIAADMSRLDPENAAIYAANAAAGAAQITALDTEIAALLAPIKDKPFVVYHDAYGYFVGQYSITLVGEIAIGDATSPSAAKLADLRATLNTGSAACIFPEANHDPKLLAQIADGTSVRIGGVLDPEGAGFTTGAKLYPDLMRALATTLADCLAES